MTKVSTEIGSIAKIVGKEKAVELVAKAGFDAWDFSMFDMVKYNDATRNFYVNEDCPLNGHNAINYAKTLRKIGEDYGIVCNQSHAPFPSNFKVIRDLYKKSIELTAVAGGKACIIHPDNDKNAEENAEMYFELLPFAKQHNVKIATENMFNWYDDDAHFAACSNEIDFKAHLDAVNDDYFVACLDIGHSEMRGVKTSAEKMILTLKDKVQYLHIHDNDLWQDYHQIPFSMKIDFGKIVAALKKIGYNGEFTLEAYQYLNSKGYTENDVFEGVKNLFSAVNKLREMFDLE